MKNELENARKISSNDLSNKENLESAQSSLMSKFQEVGSKMYENQATANAHPEKQDDVIDATVE